MFRALSLFLGFVLASLGLAAFDLQFVKKYNSSQLGPSNFTHVQPDLQGGFYAAGQAGLDMLIVRFDRFGSITHTRVWDTPYVGQERVRGLTISTSGDVYAIASVNTTRPHLVKFNENLIPQWFVEMPTNAVWATNASGVTCYVESISETQIRAQVISASGALGNSLTISASRYGVISPCDSTANPGFFLSGARNDQALIARITNTAGGVYTRLTTAVAHATNRFEAITGDATGVATALGIIYDGSVARIGLFRISSTGTMTSTLYPAVTSPEIESVKLYGTVARALIGGGGIDIVHEFNRTTFATIRSYTRAKINDFSVLTGPSLLVTASEDGEMARFNLSGSSAGVSTTGATVASTPLDADQMVSVGSYNEDAYAVWYRDGLVRGASYRFAGPVERELYDSDLGPNGALAQSMRFDETGLDDYLSTIIAYRSDGGLSFAKGFFPGFQAFGARVLAMADGSVLAVGGVNNGVSSVLGATHYSASGAPLFTRTYALPSGLVFAVDVKFISGLGFFVLGSIDNKVVMLRLATNGLVTWHQVIDEDVTSVSNLTVTPANDLAYINRVAGGGAELVLVDSASGTVLQRSTIEASTVWSHVSTALTPSGALIACVSRNLPNSTLLRRYDPSTLTQTAAYSDASSTSGMAISANGRVGLTQYVDDARITLMSDSFTGVVSTMIDPSVSGVFDIAMGPTGNAYIIGRELPSPSIQNTYVAKYLPNGVRSAVRRLSGRPGQIFANSTSVWVTGDTPTRAKGINPYAAKYSP